MTQSNEKAKVNGSKWYAVEIFLRLAGVDTEHYEPSELFEALLYDESRSPLSAVQRERLETLLVQLQEAEANKDCRRIAKAGPGACIRVLECIEEEFNERIDKLLEALCEPIAYKEGVLDEIERYQEQFARRIAALTCEGEHCTGSVAYSDVMNEQLFSGHK